MSAKTPVFRVNYILVWEINIITDTTNVLNLNYKSWKTENKNSVLCAI